MKNWFMLYWTQWEVIKKLSSSDQASLLRAVYSYHVGEPIDELSAIADLAFTMLKTQFEMDNKKYEKTVEARKQAGSRWGVAKVANAKIAKQKVAKGSKASDKDNVNDNVKENENDVNNILFTETFSDENEKKYSKQMLDNFFSYRIETNQKGTPRRKLEKTRETPRRLVTRHTNQMQRSFSKSPPTNALTQEKDYTAGLDQFSSS